VPSGPAGSSESGPLPALDATTGELSALPADSHVRPIDDDTDPRALAVAAAQGDHEAFGRLYDRYVATVYRYVYYRVGQRELAEDITSDVFVRALRALPSYLDTGRDPGAWLVTIARNLVFDHYKSSRYRLEAQVEEDALLTRADSDATPEEQAVTGDVNAQLLAAVARLRPDQQEVVSLRFLQGLSVAETAQIMGRTEGAVKALQHRALRALQKDVPEGLR
jgi:RNA polymerase sigma-70 factor (ECF subfamily)